MPPPSHSHSPNPPPKRLRLGDNHRVDFRHKINEKELSIETITMQKSNGTGSDSVVKPHEFPPKAPQ